MRTPSMEKTRDQRERFWKISSKCAEYCVVVVKDMNDKVGTVK